MKKHESLVTHEIKEGEKLQFYIVEAGDIEITKEDLSRLKAMLLSVEGEKEIEEIKTIKGTCPICKVQTDLPIPVKSFANAAEGITTIFVSGDCSHDFGIFLDKNGKIRGYQKADLSMIERVTTCEMIDSTNRPITYSEKQKLSSVLAEAFSEYPTFTIGLSEGSKQSKVSKLKTLFKVLMDYTEKNGIIIWRNDLKGVLLALHSSNLPINNARMVIAGAANIPLKLGMEFTNLQQKIGEIQERERLKYVGNKEHYYLWALGVSTKEQGKGYGKGLVKYLLASFLENDDLCYLETSSETNVVIYEKLGFKLVGSSKMLIKGKEINNFSMVFQKIV